MAGKGWSGILNLFLGQEREKKNRSSNAKPVAVRRLSAAFAIPAVKPVMRFMPTYRLEPKVPLNKEVCEKIMKQVVDRTFENFNYSPKHALILSAEVSEEIKNRIKDYNFDRYRYVCTVSVGEKVMQGYCSKVNFLWDEEKDGFVSYTFDMPSFFAIATLYYLYYD